MEERDLQTVIQNFDEGMLTATELALFRNIRSMGLLDPVGKGKRSLTLEKTFEIMLRDIANMGGDVSDLSPVLQEIHELMNK
jgi:hypothetical protein